MAKNLNNNHSMAAANILERDFEAITRRVDLRPLKNKRALIAGATGFLGQYVTGAIVAANRKHKLNCKIVCVSLRGPSTLLKSYIQDKDIIFKKMDLAKPFTVPGEFDYIIHAAGYGQPSRFVKDPASTAAVNVVATEKFLSSVERSKGTMIFFSSAETYGEMPRDMRAFKETYLGASPVSGPRAVYGASKRLGEALCSYFADYRNVHVKVVRISHVYGPGAPKDDTRVMSDFIRKARLEGSIRLLDAGASVKTYGYLADVVSMILFAGIHGREMIYNVGGRDTMSIRQLAGRIGKQCGAKVMAPSENSRAAHVGRDPGFVRLDLSKILGEMKRFPFTPFKKGLTNTIEWAKI